MSICEKSVCIIPLCSRYFSLCGPWFLCYYVGRYNFEWLVWGTRFLLGWSVCCVLGGWCSSLWVVSPFCSLRYWLLWVSIEILCVFYTVIFAGALNHRLTLTLLSHIRVLSKFRVACSVVGFWVFGVRDLGVLQARWSLSSVKLVCVGLLVFVNIQRVVFVYYFVVFFWMLRVTFCCLRLHTRFNVLFFFGLSVCWS